MQLKLRELIRAGIREKVVGKRLSPGKRSSVPNLMALFLLSHWREIGRADFIDQRNTGRQHGSGLDNSESHSRIIG